METRYIKAYSPALGRDMECKIYGHGGKPALFIPCQDGRFFDFENFKMADAWAPWIESGQVMVFAIDTLDQETWSNKGGDPYWRIRRHEDWVRYVTDEMVPFIRRTAREYNGWNWDPGILVYGASLGATHAANFFFRFPDLFDSLLALSGMYTGSYGFGDYMDELVYANSPVDYLANMPPHHPYIEKYNRNNGILCVGHGPWEYPETTHRLGEIFREKGIDVWVEYWGNDVAHDWDWWFKQVAYLLPRLL